MKLLLDTSFLIELKKGNERARGALNRRKEECEDLAVSALTVYELMTGANYIWRKYGNAREMLMVEEMLKPLTIVPVDEEVVRKASAVRAELMLKGLSIPDVDLLIACCGEDFEILTFDSDFALLRDFGFDVEVL